MSGDRPAGWGRRLLSSARVRILAAYVVINDDHLARLSPLQHEHVLMLGTFPFTLPHELAAGQRRALRTDDDQPAQRAFLFRYYRKAEPQQSDHVADVRLVLDPAPGRPLLAGEDRDARSGPARTARPLWSRALGLGR